MNSMPDAHEERGRVPFAEDQQAILCVVLLFFAGLLLTGCTTPKIIPYGEAQVKAVKLVQKGMAAEEIGEEKKAYVQAIQIDPYNVLAHNNLGVCLFIERQYYKAAREFDSAMKLAPNAAEPHFNLALLFETVGKIEQASEHYDRALEIAPQSAKYRVCLARTYIKRNAEQWRTKQLLDEALKRELDPEVIAWIRDAQERLKDPRFDLDPLR